MNARAFAVTGTLSLALAACSAEPVQEPPLAGEWTLDSSTSRLSFVTIKAGEIAEAHRFDDLSGAVSADGTAGLMINLASVNTAVDIRDERMRDMLFEVARFAEANAAVQLDAATFEAMQTGETLVQPVTATLDLHGITGEVATEVAVTRISPDRVQVQTVAPVIVDARTFGLAEGVEQLREVAGLPSITPQVPVTFSLTYTRTVAE